MRTLYCFFLLLFVCVQSVVAQQITDAQTIHPQDSGLLTAGALDAAGNLYLASTRNLKYPPGESGIAGIFPSGDPVLSKYGPDGSLIWRRAFPGNIARFSDLAITPEQNLIVTGGYVDTFRLGSAGQIPGEAGNGSFFIAQLDPEGNFLWMDTDISSLPEDCMGWALAVGPDAIFVAGMHEAIYSSLRRYDFQGNLQAEKIVDIRTISDLMLDEDGRLYAVGTAAPEALFNGFPVPEPPMPTGYANYIARLDNNFQVQWMHSYSYITFDEHPKGAVFEGQPVLLSQDLDEVQGISGVYRLKVYTPEGIQVHSDSILSGFFFLNYEHFALQPFCDRLLMVYPSEAGFAIKSFDTDFQDSVLVQSSQGSFSGSYPFVCTQGERAVMGSSFQNAELNIGSAFSLHNNHAPALQQFLVELACNNASSGSPDISTTSEMWTLTPNPAENTVFLNRTEPERTQDVQLQLFNAQGRLCWQGASAEPHIPVSLAGIDNGIYFLKITSGNGTKTLKGIKLRDGR